VDLPCRTYTLHFASSKISSMRGSCKLLTQICPKEKNETICVVLTQPSCVVSQNAHLEGPFEAFDKPKWKYSFSSQAEATPQPCAFNPVTREESIFVVCRLRRHQSALFCGIGAEDQEAFPAGLSRTRQHCWKERSGRQFVSNMSGNNEGRP
jgi:hypothetical protein